MVTEIPLSRGLVAFVDDEDAAAVLAVGKWYARPGGRTFYARKNFWVDGRCLSTSIHRFLTGWTLTDHINRNGLDNRRENLRPAQPWQNNGNTRRRKDNSSGFKGVSPYKATNRWGAHIGQNGDQHHLGYFATAEAAARAYDAAALAYFGEFAVLNFPEEHTP